MLEIPTHLCHGVGENIACSEDEATNLAFYIGALASTSLVAICLKVYLAQGLKGASTPFPERQAASGVGLG